MADNRNNPAPPGEVQDYYASFPEESRLASSSGRLELERTKDILTRVLPQPPCRIIDVGGAAGVYSIWLASGGYEVHLVDASPRLVEEARQRSSASARPVASVAVGDARSLPQSDGFADVILVMGPLYHLTMAEDRARALQEARRVLKPGGMLVAAAISRFASALDGLARGLTKDPAFIKMRDRDLMDGQHRNEAGNIEYFTTAYFHRPDELGQEIEWAGFEDVSVYGVEGPGWRLSDIDSRANDAEQWTDLMHVARALEHEPSIIGASAHLLGVGRRL